MIVLDTTSDVVRVTLGAAHTTNALEAVACWRDITTSLYTPGRTLATSNGTTAANLVGSPAASTQRLVDFLSLHNKDTITHTVTLGFYNGTTEYLLWKGSLAAGERVEYGHGGGFRVFTASGLEKVQSMLAGGRPDVANWQFKWLTTEFTHTGGTTPADITGLDIDVTLGYAYYARFAVNVRTSATTTGARVGFAQSAGFVTTGYAACRLVRPLTGATEEYTYSGVSVGSAGATTPLAQRYGGNLFTGEIIFVPEATTAGGLKLQIAAEVAGDIYAEPGSVLMFTEYAI